MNARLDARIVGMLAGLVGVFLCLPLLVAAGLGEPVRPFLSAMAISLVLVLAGYLAGQGADKSLRTRDGYVIVAMGWLAASFVAAVPYWVSGYATPIDSIFEAVSGITTTGSTIFTDIESLPDSILLWRSMTQWIGGMGIIVFTIAVLPLLGVGGMQLFKAEVPGPVADKVAPRVAVTARYLWMIYVGLTVAEILLLRIGGMSLFDAVNHSFTTLATGGFSPKNESIAAYGSPFIRWVIIVFMFLAGVNFVLHFKLVTGRWRSVLRDEEIRWYVAMIAIFSLPVAATLWFSGRTFYRSVEEATFTVVSLITTTGYATADYELWPVGLHGPILILLVVGAMAGSTGGGIKTLRTLLAFRSLRMSFRRMLHPHGVHPVTYRGSLVAPEIREAVWGFFFAYMLVAVVGMLVIHASGADLVTAWSASLTAVGNVGPGLMDVGPTDNFAHLPGYAKLVLSFLMLCGRLELYTVLLVLMPGFWRR